MAEVSAMGSTATDNSILATHQGKLILALVCFAAFLDVIDTTIVNIALPSIREHIHFAGSEGVLVALVSLRSRRGDDDTGRALDPHYHLQRGKGAHQGDR